MGGRGAGDPGLLRALRRPAAGGARGGLSPPSRGTSARGPPSRALASPRPAAALSRRLVRAPRPAPAAPASGRARRSRCGLEVRHLGAGGEGVHRQVAQVVGVAHRDVDEEVVLRRRRGRRAIASGSVSACWRNASTRWREWRRSRTKTSACRRDAERRGSTSARKPRQHAPARRRRTRSRQLDGASPTRAASSLFDSRALFCRAARMREVDSVEGGHCGLAFRSQFD